MRNKITIIILGLIISVLSLHAEDIITLNDGDVIKAVVREIGVSEIKYNKASNLNGPVYVIEKSKVFSIKFENGEIEKFSSTTNESKDKVESDKSNEGNEVKVARLKASAENVSKLEWYNDRFKTYNKKIKGKFENSLVSVKLGFTSNSVIDNGIISIDFEHVRSVDWEEFSAGTYGIKITNNSDHSIVVDKAKSYKIFPNGSFKAFYDGSTQTSVSSGSSSGASIGLGAITGALGIGGIVGTLASGLSVGGGKSSSIVTTYNEQQYVMIPPKGWAYLVKPMQIKKDEWLGSWETFCYWLGEGDKTVPNNFIHKNEMIDIEESDEWILRKYGIVFFYGENLDKCDEMNFDLVVQQIIGDADNLSYFDTYKQKNKMEKKIRENIPDYEENRHITGTLRVSDKKN